MAVAHAPPSPMTPPPESQSASAAETSFEAESQVYFLGRQPVLDLEGRIAAHELLFRDSGASTEARFEDGLRATARVLIATFCDVGPEAILGGLPGFVNADARLEIAEHVDSLPEAHIVFDLPPVVEVDDVLIERIEQLRREGFELCLDGYTYKDSRASLLPYVSYAKVDVTQNDPLRLHKIARELKEHAVTKVAARVETEESYRVVEKQGWDLVQGYFFARPETIARNRPSTRRSRLLEVVTAIDHDTPVHEVSERLRMVPHLTMNVLGMANLMRGAPGSRIESIQQAVVMVGRKRLIHWLHLLMFASDDRNGCADPVCQLATARSRTLESLSAIRVKRELASDDGEPDRASLTGMLSLAAPLLGMKPKEVARKFSLDYSIEQALMRREGPLGKLLRLRERREEGALDEVAKLLGELGLSPADLQDSEIQAADWVNALSGMTTNKTARAADA